MIEYDGVDDGSGRNGDFNKKFYSRLQYNSRITHPLTSMLRTSSSTDLSTSTAQIVVEFDEVDMVVVLLGCRSKSCQKVEKVSKSPKKLKDLKSCEHHQFGRTFYQRTNPLSIRYKELELLLEF